MASSVPRSRLEQVREAALDCRACELWKIGTQTVFGEGPAHADMMLVGEQPGDREDRAGRPFVGPAGRVLDDALQAAGIARERVYVTNAVKHFKWEPRGKRRLHKKPNQTEITACRPWLQAEFMVIKPKMIVCLGATAAQALIGRTFRITQQRGTFLSSEWADWIMATYHPSAILRAPNRADRERLRSEFIADLHQVAQRLQEA